MNNHFRRVFAGLGCAVMLASCAGGAPAVTALTVRATGAEMAYQPASMTVPAGAAVELTFENNSDFSHNFILINGDEATLTAVDVGGDKAGESGGYIPVNVPGTIAESTLLTAGQTGVVKFTAPAAGTYFYFCTYPSHLEAGMRGVLTVE